MYLIEQGKICISMKAADGHEVTIAELGAGDFFGEMALIDGKPRSARATALEPARLAISLAQAFPLLRSGQLAGCHRNAECACASPRRTDELLQNRITRNVNEEEAATLTFADHAVDVIAEFRGSWKFIIVSLATLVVWIVANTARPVNQEPVRSVPVHPVEPRH